MGQRECQLIDRGEVRGKGSVSSLAEGWVG